MEKAGEMGEFSRTTELGKHGPRRLAIARVKGLRQVDEDRVEVHLSLDVFLLDLSYREDHVDSAASRSEAKLCLWQAFYSDTADHTLPRNIPAMDSRWMPR